MAIRGTFSVGSETIRGVGKLGSAAVDAAIHGGETELERKRKEEMESNKRKPQQIGVVESVRLDDQFVIIKRVGELKVEPGQEIFTYMGNRKTARLRVSPEKKWRRIVADIVEGTPSPGQVVMTAGLMPAPNAPGAMRQGEETAVNATLSDPRLLDPNYIPALQPPPGYQGSYDLPDGGIGAGQAPVQPLYETANPGYPSQPMGGNPGGMGTIERADPIVSPHGDSPVMGRPSYAPASQGGQGGLGYPSGNLPAGSQGVPQGSPGGYAPMSPARGAGGQEEIIPPIPPSLLDVNGDGIPD